MYILNTWRDPYDEGFNISNRRQIELQEGVTVLVGCNGFGKTTTLHNLKEQLRKQNIVYYYYDNLHDGGSTAMDSAMHHEDFSFVSALMRSSEGENISLNLGNIATSLGKYIRTGEDQQKNPFSSILGDDKEIPKTNKRFILLDAIDSGYSIDNVLELKDLFNIILEESNKLELETYIIVSANEYELADGEPCLDVSTGKYITFDDYDDYKRYILKTRAKKEKRYEKLRNKVVED